MGISLSTVITIQTNEIKVIDTTERSEAWMVKGGNLHSLLLSCPLDKRSEMEKIISEIQSENFSVFSKNG
jgi:hypothetical protein